MRYTVTEQISMQGYLTTLIISAICEHTGAKAGSIEAVISPDQASITPLDVAQPYRLQGIARQLLKLMLNKLSGVRFGELPIYIHVLPYKDDPDSRAQLVALYSQYGFVGIEETNFMRLVQPAPPVPSPSPSVLTRKERAGLNYTLKHHANVYRALKDR